MTAQASSNRGAAIHHLFPIIKTVISAKNKNNKWVPLWLQVILINAVHWVAMLLEGVDRWRNWKQGSFILSRGRDTSCSNGFKEKASEWTWEPPLLLRSGNMNTVLPWHTFSHTTVKNQSKQFDPKDSIINIGGSSIRIIFMVFGIRDLMQSGI